MAPRCSHCGSTFPRCSIHKPIESTQVGRIPHSLRHAARQAGYTIKCATGDRGGGNYPFDQVPSRGVGPGFRSGESNHEPSYRCTSHQISMYPLSVYETSEKTSTADRHFPPNRRAASNAMEAQDTTIKPVTPSTGAEKWVYLPVNHLDAQCQSETKPLATNQITRHQSANRHGFDSAVSGFSITCSVLSVEIIVPEPLITALFVVAS